MKITKLRRTKSELLMAVILHRHGARYPKKTQWFPSFPYQDSKYYPFGDAALTREGKNQVYDLGKNLRKRFEGFLNPTYLMGEIGAFSSNTDRTKMSCQLMLTGLFPPTKEQVWNEEFPNWQPIPYTTLSFNEDKLLVSPSTFYCPFFEDIYLKEGMYSQLGRDIMEKYKPEMEILEKVTEHEDISVRKAYTVYDTLRSTINIGLPLPEWDERLPIEKLEEIACYEYYLMTHSPLLRSLCAGGLARFVQLEFERKLSGMSPRRFVTLSGHESTIAFQLVSYGMFDHKFPGYASYLMWQLVEADEGLMVIISYLNTSNPPERELARIPLAHFNDLCNSIHQFTRLDRVVYR